MNEMIVSVAINTNNDYSELRDNNIDTSIGGSFSGGIKGSII